MRLKQPMAYVLALVMMFTTVLTGSHGIYGAELPVTEQAYQSVLSQQGGAKDSYLPGDTVTLQLSVSPQEGGNFGIRGYDNTIEIDTTKLELVEASPGALSNRTTLNLNYGSTEGNKQKIKWMYMDQNPAEQSGSLQLGTITLRVKSDIISGTTAIRQAVEGIYDANGAWVRTIKAENVTLTLQDSKPAYHFGLEVMSGEKDVYYPGDQITVRSYLTSSAVSFSVNGASTTLGIPDSALKIVSYQTSAGIMVKETAAGEQKNVSVTYLNSNSSAAGSLELTTFVLQVKETADPGLFTIGQSEKSVYISPESGMAASVSGAEVSFQVGTTTADCEFLLTTHDGKTTYEVGETVELDLVVKKAGTFVPRIANSEISFSKDTFAFVKTTALAGTSIEEDAGLVKWLYYNTAAPAATDSLKLGSITLRVKAAPTAVTVINQEEANLAVLEDSQLEECIVKTAPLRLNVYGDPIKPSVSPSTAFYDTYASTGALKFAIAEGSYGFTGTVSLDAKTLEKDVDYRLSGTTVTLVEACLKAVSPGAHTLSFSFAEGEKVNVTLQISDSTPIKTYALTVAPNYYSMGTAEGGGSYAAGEEIALKATAEAGYRFVRWDVKGGFGSVANPTEAQTTFTMPAGAALVTAIFTNESDRVYNAVLETEGTSSAALLEGDTFDVTATLRESEGAPYRIRLLEETIPIDTSRFEITGFTPAAGAYLSTKAGVESQEIVTIFYSSQSVENMTGDLALGTLHLKVREAAPAGEVSLSAAVSGISDKDELDPSIHTASIPLKLTLQEKYALHLKVNDTAMGRITAGDDGRYKAGTQIHVAAEPNSGYKFVEWQSSGGGSFASATAAATTFTIPYAATTVTAIFAAMSDPTVTPGEASYDKNGGSAVSFAISGGDYTFDAIQKGNETLAAGQDYTLSESRVTLSESYLKALTEGAYTLSFLFKNASSAEKTVSVNLKVIDSTPPPPERYTLTAEPNFNSMGTVTGGGSFAAGEKVTLSALAKEGYRFVKWEVPARVEIDDVTTATAILTMPAGPIKVTALFASANERAYEALLTLENEQETYQPGEQVVVRVQAKAKDDQPYGIRMLETDVKVDTSIFEITSFAGINGAVITVAAIEGGGNASNVRIYYYNGDAAETATEATNLAQLILTVKEDAASGSASLTQSVTGFVDAKGDDLSGNMSAAGTDIVIEEAPKGVTVSGKVNSYNPGNKTTLQLIKDDIVVYQTTIDPESGNGAKEQEFRFEGVAADTYTLYVTKAAHTSYTVHNVVVGETTDLDLTQDSRAGAALISLLAGDINGDGTIGAGDINLILNVANNGKAPGTEGVNDLTDVNGDGTIGAGDINIILNVANNGKGNVVID